MDALSETLRVVRMSGAIFTHAKFGAPWCYQAPPAAAVAPILDPEADHIVVFHMIIDGECFVEMDNQPAMRLVAGDVVLFPGGHAHRMASSPGVPPAHGPQRLGALLTRRPCRLVYGGSGVATRLICGYLSCDERVMRLLLTGLPPIVRVGMRDSRAGTWLEASITYALGETRSPAPGGSGMLAKLAELLFIEVLRAHMNSSEEHRTGWLAGVKDRTVGTALGLLHKRPAHTWTLSELARVAGTSRSVLAERFRQIMGTTPIQYLTQWRMLLAANLLRHSNTPLTRIAESIGYQTDTAFIRAFRRQFGCPPALWRRTGGKARNALMTAGSPSNEAREPPNADGGRALV